MFNCNLYIVLGFFLLQAINSKSIENESVDLKDGKSKYLTAKEIIDSLFSMMDEMEAEIEKQSKENENNENDLSDKFEWGMLSHNSKRWKGSKPQNLANMPHNYIKLNGYNGNRKFNSLFNSFNKARL